MQTMQTAELQKIYELSFSDYEWVTPDDALISIIKSNHFFSLFGNELHSLEIVESNNLSTLIKYAEENEFENKNEYVGLYKKNGKVRDRIISLKEERKKINNNKDKSCRINSAAFILLEFVIIRYININFIRTLKISKNVSFTIKSQIPSSTKDFYVFISG